MRACVREHACCVREHACCVRACVLSAWMCGGLLERAFIPNSLSLAKVAHCAIGRPRIFETGWFLHTGTKFSTLKSGYMQTTTTYYKSHLNKGGKVGADAFS